MPRVVHFEIQAENPHRAIAFYTRMFGWKFQKWDEPVAYWFIATGDTGPGINRDLLPRHGLAPAVGQSVNAYVCTVDVSNLDESWNQALAAGATAAVATTAVPRIGSLAYLKDTEEKFLGMIQYDPQATKIVVPIGGSTCATWHPSWPPV